MLHTLGNMIILCVLVLLPALLLGVLVWTFFQHYFITDVPSAVKHPVKLKFMHCFLQFFVNLGYILEKLKICSMPKFIFYIHECLKTRKDSRVVVTDLHFGTIPVRIFQPKSSSSNLHRGIVYYHCGGGIFGSIDFCHSFCNLLVVETDSVVLSVGYRKCPDYHFSMATLDCLTATIQFLKSLKSYGVDPSKVVICGDSFGGGLAARITQILVEWPDVPKIRAQVLIYPIIQVINMQLPSYQQNKNVPFLTLEMLIACLTRYMAVNYFWKDAIVKGMFIPPEMWRKYRKWLSADNLPPKFKKTGHQVMFPGPFNEAAYLECRHFFDVEAAPLLVDDKIIAQLPETFLVSCEYDILRDECLLYKKRLEDNGVPVSWFHAEDGFHGCIGLFDKGFLSFPCVFKIINALVKFLKGL